MSSLIRSRIYPRFAIHAQTTGRWSTTDPPLAQLPRALRDLIIPDPGEAWIAWDWVGIEEVLLGAITGELTILNALARGDDLHEQQAVRLFGSVAENKAEPYRTFTKRFKFRLYYGGDPAQCGDIPGAQQLGLNRQRLNALGARFLTGLPHYLRWRESVKAGLIRTDATGQRAWTRMGESRDHVGRRRRLVASTGMSRVREAWNNPLQMGAASILNLTLVRLHHRAPWALFVYTMHDAATIACPAERAEELQDMAKEETTRPWPIVDQDGVTRAIPFRAEFAPILYGSDVA